MVQRHPVAQVAVLVTLESFYYALHWILQPYTDRAINIHYLMFGTLRCMAVWLSIAYIPQIGASAVARHWVAYLQIILHFVCLLVMLILPIKNLLILVTGMMDTDLFDAKLPPPRMVVWRRRLHLPRLVKPAHTKPSFSSSSSSQLQRPMSSFVSSHSSIVMSGRVNREMMTTVPVFYESNADRLTVPNECITLPQDKEKISSHPRSGEEVGGSGSSWEEMSLHGYQTAAQVN
ncbi:hypothetical protein BDF14DRAFT_1807184 [Spinellus fusiger]|nr:hypothetical protein BDF14DRAFT_1807184 [Spinellus fusiger]